MNTIDHPSYDRPVRDLRKVRINSKMNLSTTNEAMLLIALYDEGPIAMNLASAVAGVSRAAMTSIADRMTDAGLTKRLPSSADRRVTTIELTKKGFLRVDAALHSDLVESS